MDAPPAFGSPPAFGFQDLFNHVIGDMAKAVCHRNGESEERRYQRLQAAVQMIMGFMPRDVIEAMLAGHCVMFHELIVDSVRHTLLGEVDTMRRATRGGIVAMDKSFRGNLDQLGHFQLRPSTGRRDVAESVAAAELRPEQNADPAMADASLADASLADASLADVSLGEAVRAEFQAAGMRAAGNAPAGPRADRPGPDTAPALTDGSVEPGLDGDYLGRDEHHPDRAGSHSGLTPGSRAMTIVGSPPVRWLTRSRARPSGSSCERSRGLRHHRGLWSSRRRPPRSPRARRTPRRWRRWTRAIPNGSRARWAWISRTRASWRRPPPRAVRSGPISKRARLPGPPTRPVRAVRGHAEPGERFAVG